MRGDDPKTPPRAGRSGTDPAATQEALVAHYAPRLEAFLAEIARLRAAVEQDHPGARIASKQRPEQLLSMLPRMLPFRQMSLLELRYTLPGTSRKPGIRFWLEGPEEDKRIRAVFFTDTVIWNVDHDLRKQQDELGSLYLRGTDIEARPPATHGQPPGGDAHRTWNDALRDMLLYPLSR